MPSRKRRRVKGHVGFPRSGWVAATAASLLLAGGLIWLNLPRAPTVARPPTSGIEPRVLGSPTAGVVITEFADFQCPACGLLARETLPPLETEYIATGQVRLEFRHFAFIGPESEWAAQAAECAGEQGQFWAFHDLLFSRQAGENRGAFSKERLKGFATELGLDGSTFNACLDSNRYAQKVEEDYRQGRELGVRATPTLFINGRKVEGPPCSSMAARSRVPCLTPP
ncbi:MAG: DsbA family protein [Chloroflexi bacterium]|nr:DsbA family protein [Chloroflexota bacterium]